MRSGREVSTEEERVTGEKLGAKVGEDSVGVSRREIADAGANIESKGAGVGETVERQALAGVVRDLNADRDAGDVGLNVLGGLIESRGRDIYG